MGPRRLLVLATYPPRAAATRFRACAYFPALERAGIEVELRPFMTDAFMASFYSPGRVLSKGLGMAAFAAKRLVELVRARRYSGVLVQREAMPIGPAAVEWWLARVTGLPLVLDIDDAVWLEQPHSKHPIAAKLLRSPQKTETILANARAVVAGTEYLASHARQTRQDVTVLPTVVSSEAWRPLPGRLEGELVAPELPTIGWIGTHGTAMHLDLVVPALEALARAGHRFKVRLVGASRELPIGNVPVESVPWSEAREREEFQRIDVGIAPVVDDAWSRGKSGFKQIQYMTVGVPFVSSPVGGATEFVVEGENGFFARSTEEWVARLSALLTDRAMRARFARAGRALVENQLSLEAQEPAFVSVIERVLGGVRAPS